MYCCRLFCTGSDKYSDGRLSLKLSLPLPNISKFLSSNDGSMRTISVYFCSDGDKYSDK